LKKTCPDCAQYKKRIEDLEGRLAYIKFELDDLKSKRFKSNKKKPPDNPPPAPSPKKKRGGLFGHTGWFRKRPKEIDITKELRLSECPERGSKRLTECKNVSEHITEDLILPRIEVTLRRKHHYYCKNCKKVVSPKDKDEISGSRIGPRAKAFAAFPRYAVKISERDVRALFEKAFNLKIAASSIAGFMDQLKREALPIYNDLLAALKKGPFIHADETGWPVDGINHWLWKFSNKIISISHIAKSRGQKVVEDMLGKNYLGVLISDFLSAYNKIITKAKQRCLAHLFRDLEKVIEYWHDDKEVLRYCRRLGKILKDAITLYKEYKNKEWDERYYIKRACLKDALNDFRFPNPNKRILLRFAKRLARHKDEILTFLYVKDIDHHNNHAEQQIRHDVIFRKITNGNRSPTGAENHSILMTILQTARLNNMDPIATLEKILLRNKENPFSKILSPPKKDKPPVLQSHSGALAYSTV